MDIHDQLQNRLHVILQVMQRQEGARHFDDLIERGRTMLKEWILDEAHGAPAGGDEHAQELLARSIADWIVRRALLKKALFVEPFGENGEGVAEDC